MPRSKLVTCNHDTYVAEEAAVESVSADARGVLQSEQNYHEYLLAEGGTLAQKQVETIERTRNKNGGERECGTIRSSCGRRILRCISHEQGMPATFYDLGVLHG